MLGRFLVAGPRVDNEPGVGLDQVVVEAVMIGREQHAVGAGQGHDLVDDLAVEGLADLGAGGRDTA